MNTKILINFDTIFWTSIDKKKTYSYVSHLKSRIYKATQKKQYRHKIFLQNQLICSSTIKYFILLEIITNTYSNYCTSKVLALVNNIYLWDKISPIYDEKKYYSSSKHTELKHDTVESILEQMNNTLLSVTLDSEIKSKQDQLNIFFRLNSLHELLTVFNTNFLNQSIEKYYFQSIDFSDYFKRLHPDYICARLDLSNLLKARIVKSFKNGMWIKYIYVLQDNKFYLENKSNKFILQNTIATFVMYILSLEVIYLSQSNIYSSNNLLLSSSSCCIVSMRLELLFWSNVDQTVSIWYKAFHSLLTYSKTKEINGRNNLPFNISKGINIAAYFLSYKKDMQVISYPSLNAQIVLMQQIDVVFLRSKGKSEEVLICDLNKVLLFWGNYFIVTHASKIFAFMDYYMHLKLCGWIFRRHPNWGRNKMMLKYFVSPDKIRKYNFTFNSRWIFHTYVDQQLIILLKLRYFTSMKREVI